MSDTRAARDTSRPYPFGSAVRAIGRLSLEAMLWSRRSLLMGALMALPVVFALVYRLALAAKTGPPPLAPADLYALIVAVYWVRNVLPLAALFYATSLVADEVEGRTLGYFLTRPLTRTAIFVGKFAAYLGTTFSIALPSCVITFYLLLSARGSSAVGAAVPDFFRDLGVIALTLATYGGLFALAGVLLKRPLIPGLVFLYGWELLANLPGYLPRLTLTAWLRSLIRYHPAQEGLGGWFEQVLPGAQAMPVLLIATGVFLYAAARVFSVREYTLGQ